MSEIATSGQLRMSLVRWALVTIPASVLLGSLSGILSNSGFGNRWFDLLAKPDIMPPGWLFGLVWPVLYTMMGLALAMILNARGAPGRAIAIALFMVQYCANLFWSPLFFAMHQISSALWLLLFILAAAIATTVAFGRIRSLAAWLMAPYLLWLSFAAILNYQFDLLNPDAEALVAPAASTQIGGQQGAPSTKDQ